MLISSALQFLSFLTKLVLTKQMFSENIPCTERTHWRFINILKLSFACTSVYHVCSALRGQKEAINVLELELQCDQQHDAKN